MDEIEQRQAKIGRIEARTTATYVNIVSSFFYLYVLYYQRVKLTDEIEGTNYASAFPSGTEMKKVYNAFLLTFLYFAGIFFYTACQNLEMELENAKHINNEKALNSAWMSFYSTFFGLDAALVLAPALFETGELPY